MLDNPFGHWAYLRDVEQIDHIYRWEREQFDLWRKASLGKAD